MSPEQATGKAADKRSDLWAFGVVLLEMLTGRRPFAGETVSHVLAAVLKDEPDWTALPPDTPASIRRLLRRCLEKDRKRRLPDGATARIEIDDAMTGRPEMPAAAVATARFRRRELAAWGVAALLAVAGVALALRAFNLSPVESATTRVSIAPPDGFAIASSGFGRSGWGSPLAVSPDGRRIVMVASGADGIHRLWVRALEATTPQLLEGTDEASSVSGRQTADGSRSSPRENSSASPRPVGTRECCATPVPGAEARGIGTT